MSEVLKKKVPIAEVEARLIKLVRAHGGLSRLHLAQKLPMAPSTSGIYVDRLIREGYVREGEKTVVCGAGRPHTLLRLNPAGGQFIGVDFFAERVMAIAIDFAAQPVEKVHRELGGADSVGRILEKIETVIRKVMPRKPERLLGIGIGAPGPVDKARGTATYYPYLRNFRDVSLTEPIRRKFGVPVYLENTISAMALAELWFGGGRGLNNFICAGIRTGIRAGVVVNGALYCGQGDAAGEIGLWRLRNPATGERGTRTAHRTLEEVASVRAILANTRRELAHDPRSLLKGRRERLTIEDIIAAFQQQDGVARRVIAAAAEELGWALGHVSLVFAPEKVILAGPLSALGEGLLAPVRKVIAELYDSTGLTPPPLEMSTMGEYIGALGAAALCVDHWRPPR